MKAIPALVGLVLCLLPSVLFAAPAQQAPHAKKTAATTSYQCSKCHMIYTSAQARKNHYKDPMDGGALLPVPAKKTPAKG